MRIDSNQEFSNVGYAFLMFLTDYYKRVGKLKLTFDEMMVLNTVAAQLGYNLKFSESLSIKDLSNLKDEKITEVSSLESIENLTLYLARNKRGESDILNWRARIMDREKELTS